MKRIRHSLLLTSLLALAACTSLQPMCPDSGQYRICPQGKTLAELRQEELARERQRLLDQLAAAQKQLGERDREIASLRSGGGDSSRLASQLSSVQADKDRLAAELATSQASLAALQAGSGDKDRLAAELAASQASLAALQAGARDKDKLAAELTAEKQRIAELERQLADRDKELVSLRGDLSAEMAKLQEAQRGLVRALRPQIEKGTITVDLNNERLLINLASGYLFGSGEDQLKPSGAEALQHVGAILKDFPEYKVSVDGHTDNRPIRSSLKTKYPTNQELSEARAANAAKALAEGGLSGYATVGYADTKPVEPNTTEEGRAKNRRVEVRVTR